MSARPTPTTALQEELYAALTPLAYDDANQNWALLKYCGALASMSDQIEGYVRDAGVYPGWSALLDPDRCPPEALPWLAQFAGVLLAGPEPQILVNTNMITNPSLETNATGHTTAGTAPSTFARTNTTAHPFSGTYSLHFAATLANSGNYTEHTIPVPTAANQRARGYVVAGKTYSFKTRAYVVTKNDAAIQHFFDWLDSAGASLGSTQVNLTNNQLGQRDLLVSAVAPAYAASCSLRTRWYGIGASGTSIDVYLDAFQFGEDVSSYFDGDTLNAVWVGTAHASESKLFRNATTDEIVARQRLRIKNTDGMKRGTLASIVAAAQDRLVGNKTVLVRERDGTAYSLTVVTYTSETPDSAAVLAAILDQKPAGIQLTYASVAGATYLLIRATYATYTAVASAFTTYNGLRNNVPGT